MTASAAAAAPTESGIVSEVVAALERAWTAIRAKHPDVPDCAMIVASGMERGELNRWGHYWHGRWEVVSAGRKPEVMISGEGLNRAAVDVLETLIHEAAHGVAATRKTADTSRQGRWHNRRYAKLAEELGLAVAKCKRYGHTTSMGTGTADRYAEVLVDLGAALKLYRVPEVRLRRVRPDRDEDGTDDGGEAGADADLDGDGIDVDEEAEVDTKNGLVGVCKCGRKLRGSVSAWRAGPISCGVCNGPFMVTFPTGSVATA